MPANCVFANTILGPREYPSAHFSSKGWSRTERQLGRGYNLDTRMALPTNTKRLYAARGAEILVGLVYLAAAVLKAQNINLFIKQILAYQVFTSALSLQTVAFVTLALETFLGLSMVLGSPWRKGVLAVSAAVLVFFTGLIAYAWQVHGLKDCGCLGAVSSTPPQAIAKNMALLALTGIAWYGLILKGDAAIGMRYRAGRMALPLLLAVGLCTAIVPQINASGNGGKPVDTKGGGGDTQPPGVFSGYQITTDFGDFDLSKGEYLVVLLSMTCEHCMASVPQINEYTAESALPQVVALCLEPEEGSMDVFQGMTGPVFPMHSIGDNMLQWSKICEGLPPRLCFVRDGVVITAWNEEMPDYETLLEAVRGTTPAETE